MASFLTWPIGLLKPKTPCWSLAGMVTSGGQSVAGISQTTNSTGGGFWRASLEDIPMLDRDMVRTWRALEALLDNGVTGIIVPFCDALYAPVLAVDPVPHSDGTFFTDETGYVAGAAECSFVGAHALRATRVEIDMGGAVLRGGEHFTVNHVAGGPRIYRVARIHEVVGDVYDITIRPPLRAAVADGDDADFVNPRCVMKLASPDEMRLPLEGNRFGNGTVNFVECLTGALEEDD